MEDLKNQILQQVYNNFVNSLGYNGCSAYNLCYDCTQDELLQCLIELIKEEEIEIITGDVGNTYPVYFFQTFWLYYLQPFFYSVCCRKLIQQALITNLNSVFQFNSSISFYQRFYS